MTFEVRPAESPAFKPGHAQIAWGDPGATGNGIRATADAWLTQLGPVSDRAIDLVRLAGAAYVADRLSRRGQGFTRTIDLHVQLCDPAPWLPVMPMVEHILGWISGDEWHLGASREDATRPATTIALADEADTVALLSGGLDSFSGALLRATPTLFVSHSDNPTVTAGQNSAWGWLAENGLTGGHLRVRFSESATKRENTTRTRALLFYALAIASADARGIASVEVPENGFTSLNLALGNDRGGVLSTRSTHPWTMHMFRALLDAVGLQVAIVNPYELCTKGELIAQASAGRADFGLGAARTLSCAKLDGRTYKGGNPNLNCGLCVACLTRRAGLLAAGVIDSTPYLATTLVGEPLQQLRTRRALDVTAVMSRIETRVDEFVLLENGPYPDAFDLTAGADLCRRGLSELAALLPKLA